MTRRGRLAVHALGDPDPPFVLVDEDRLVAAILDTLDVPILPADPRDGRDIAARILEATGVSVRPVGATDVRVLVDDAPLSERDGILLVGPDRPWLADLVALTLEFKASAFNRQTDQRIRTAIEQLRLIRLHTGDSVEVELRGAVVPLPSHLRRVFAVATPGQPAIAYVGTADGLTWDTLALLATKIGELTVGSVETSNALESVVISLGRRLGGLSFTAPSDDDYAGVLEESAERVAQVRQAHRQGALGLADLRAPSSSRSLART